MTSTFRRVQVTVVGGQELATGLEGASDDSGRLFEIETVRPAEPSAQLEKADCLLLDQQLAGEPWQAVLDRITDARPALPVVVALSREFEQGVETAIEAGAAGYLPRSLCEARPDLVAGRLAEILDRSRGGVVTPGGTLDAVDVPVSVLDHETGEIAGVNAAMADVVDDGPGRLAGRDADEIWEPADTAVDLSSVATRVAESESGETHELAVDAGDGTTRWLAAAVRPVAAPDQPSVVVSGRDVTERKQRLPERGTVVDQFEQAAATHDPETGTIRKVNDALVELLGYERETLHERGIDALVAADRDDGPGEPVAVTEAVREMQPGCHEWQVETAAGETRQVATHVWPGADASGQCVFTRHRDITAEKRRERQLREVSERFELVTENVDEIIYIANEDFTEVEYVNSAYEDIWGRPIEEAYADATAFVDGIDPRDREAFDDYFETMRADIRAGDPDQNYELEYRVRQPDGEIRWILVTGYPVATEYGEDRFVGIAEDITERRELERTYRELFESVSDGLVIHEPESGEIVDVNERFCEMNGYSREELIGETVGLISPEEYSYATARERIQRAREEGPQLFEWRNERADGETFPVEVNLTFAQFRGEERVIASVRDISNRRETEARFQTIVERIDAGVALVPEGETEPAYLNPVYEDLTGLPLEELYDPETFVERIHHEDREGYISDVGSMVEDILGGEASDSYECEFRFQRADGEIRWFHWTGYPLVEEDNDYSYVGLTTDVTERRERQERIRENERTYRELFNKSRAGITVHDPETREMVGVNDTMCELLGYDRETILERDIAGVSVTGEEYSVDRSEEVIERVMASGETVEFEWLLEDSDGEHHWMLVNGTPATIGGERRFLATSQEITERKHREREFEQIFHGVHDPITIHDPDTADLLEVNDAFCDLLGYDHEEILDMGIEGYSSSVHDNPAEQAREFVREVVETGEPKQTEWAVETRDGETRWLEVKGTVVEIGGQKRYVSIDRDVTERRRREREYEQIFDGVNDSIAVHDPDTGEMLAVNETLCDRTGYDREELLEVGADGLTVDTEEFSSEQVQEIIEQVTDGEDVDPYEQAIETADGELRWLEVNPTRAVIDGEERFLAISRDVTARRERQKRLETERDRRSTLFENTPDPIMAVEFRHGDPYITEINPSFEETFGFDAESVADRPIADVIVPEGEREGYEAIRQQALAGEPVKDEVRRETAGGVRDFLLQVLPFESGGDRHAYVWFSDITERKRRERAIEEERQKYSTLVEQSTDGVVVVRDEEYVFVNEQFAEITGYDRDELVGTSLGTVFTPSSRELVRERYRKRVTGGSPPSRYDVEVETADGGRVTLELKASRIRHEGEPATLANFRDVTERRERERAVEQLQRATERFQSAGTTGEVYDIAVETARDVLGLPMTACWRHEDDARRLTCVAGTDTVEQMEHGPVPFTADDYEYGVFTAGEALTYDPGKHHTHNPLERCILVAIGEYGLLAAGQRGREEYEPYLVDVAQVLAGHATAALDRVTRAEQLRRSEHRLQAIVDRIDEAIFLAPVSELNEAEPAPDFVSSGYEEIWDQPLETLHETYDDGFFATLHPDDYDTYMTFIDSVTADVETGDPEDSYQHEYRIRRPDGDVRWVRSDFYPTEWTDGQPRIVVASRDITDRKERERTLESFHDATGELTTANTVTEAGATAVGAAADVFDLPATAVYHYNEETATLEPTATGPEAPDTADLTPLTADHAEAWEAFVGETIQRVDARDKPALDVGPSEDLLLFPLGGNGVLAIWRAGESFDTEAASILAATLEAALNRLRGERQLESRREELEAQTQRAQRLEAIAELTQRVEAAITANSSREGIQEAVCAELVDVEPFDAAWVAAAPVGTEQLVPRAFAGLDRDLVERALVSDTRGRSEPHPVTEAWQTREPFVVNDLVGGSRRSDWGQALLKTGAGAVCAVPLAYSGITYGVLTVVAGEPDAFGDREVEVLSQLGTSIGYAITAIERQRALESDDTLEVEFRGTGIESPFARLARELDCRVRHERTIRRQDGSVSVYYTLSGDIPDTVDERPVEILPGEVAVVSRQDDEALIERRGSSWFGALISEYGGILRRGRATPSGVELVVELPRETDTRTIVDRLQAEFPALEVTAQRQHRETSTTPSEVRQQLEQRLTDRQHEALETAHAMGYFEWPRESSGEEIAQTLGITQPTVNKHLRLGEQKVFDLLFDAPSAGRPA